MEDYIKFKRKNGRLHHWPCKLYIPVPLTTKNLFAEQARRFRVSQAELGAVIVSHYVANPSLVDLVVVEYQELEHKLRNDFLEQEKQKAEQPFDRTFGGNFKSSFPESDCE